MDGYTTLDDSAESGVALRSALPRPSLPAFQAGGPAVEGPALKAREKALPYGGKLALRALRIP